MPEDIGCAPILRGHDDGSFPEISVQLSSGMYLKMIVS